MRAIRHRFLPNLFNRSIAIPETTHLAAPRKRGR
jgi:hypothetical protein